MDVGLVVEQMRRMGRLMRNLSRRLDKSSGKRNADHHPDMTISQMRTIWLLDSADSYTMSELASRSAVSRPAATSNVDALEKRGVIERFTDPSDRRIVRVKLSPKGKKWCREHRKQHRESMTKMLSKLKDDERKELARTLDRICSILERIDTQEK